MPELIVLLFVVTSATSKEPQWKEIAQAKDLPTCDTLAAMLNDYTKDEPDIVFVCKERKVAKA